MLDIHLHHDSHCDYGRVCGLWLSLGLGIRLQSRLPITQSETFHDRKKPGLYANIHAKQDRIAKGSDEHMNKAGSKEAPGEKNFKKAAETKKKTPDKASK